MYSIKPASLEFIITHFINPYLIQLTKGPIKDVIWRAAAERV